MRAARSVRTPFLLRRVKFSSPHQRKKKREPQGLSFSFWSKCGGIPCGKILTLAAYKQARRALRGECEPNSRAGKMRTNISNEPSANIVKMREVGSRPCRLRQNKKRPSKTVFLVEAAGLEPTVSSTRSDWEQSFDYSCLLFSAFKSENSAFGYSRSHCFRTVQICRWS